MWIKRLGQAGFVAFLLLCCVLVLRTYYFPSKQLIVDNTQPDIDVDKELLAKQLSMSITFATISNKKHPKLNTTAFVGLISYLKSAFPRVHDVLQVRRVNGRHLVYLWKGKDESLKPVLFVAHTDVVPVESKSLPAWHHPPFSGRIEEGFIWGRGSMDDKSSAIATLAAMEYLLKQGFQPQRSIYFAIGGDEETGGMTGAAVIAQQFHKQGISFNFVLDEGGVISDGLIQGVEQPVALIGIAEKGYLSLELNLHSPGGHSSMPPSETAVGILGKAIFDLEQNPLPTRLTPAVNAMFDYIGPEMPFMQRMVMANRWLFSPLLLQRLSQRPSNNASIRTTTVATKFNAGLAENTLPKNATAVLNSRLLSGDSRETVKQHIESIVGHDDISIKSYGSYQAPSMVSKTDNQAFTLLHESVKTVFPDVVVAPFLVIASTDSRHYAKLADNVYRFQPAVYNQQDLARFHGVNERISIDALAKMMIFYTVIMAKL